MHYNLSLITDEKPDKRTIEDHLAYYSPDNLITIEYYDKEEMLGNLRTVYLGKDPDAYIKNLMSDDASYERAVRERFDFPYETDEDPGIDEDGDIHIKEPEDLRFDWYDDTPGVRNTVLIKKDGGKTSSCRISELDLNAMNKISMDENGQDFSTYAIYDPDNTGTWMETDDFLMDSYEEYFKNFIENPEHSEFYITVIDCHI